MPGHHFISYKKAIVPIKLKATPDALLAEAREHTRSYPRAGSPVCDPLGR
jgi:hypothetical protein